MKNKNLKKMLALLLVSVLLLLAVIIPVKATMITPYYNNVISANSYASVSDGGIISITNTFRGTSGVTTKAVITTYIEKRFLGLFWNRVEIEETDDEWVDTIYNYTYSGSHSFQLSSTGTYRVTVIYEIYGNGGSADEIKKEIQVTYD